MNEWMKESLRSRRTVSASDIANRTGVASAKLSTSSTSAAASPHRNHHHHHNNPNHRCRRDRRPSLLLPTSYHIIWYITVHEYISCRTAPPLSSSPPLAGSWPLLNVQKPRESPQNRASFYTSIPNLRNPASRSSFHDPPAPHSSPLHL